MDDQRALLNQICELLATERPDALLMAGDIYDVTNPPEYAVELLDEFLHQVGGQLGIRTVMIPGNHDAAVRLSFGSRAFREELHIAGRYRGPIEPVVIHDEHGPVEIFPLPFLRPSRVREASGDPEVVDQQSAMERALSDLGPRPEGTRRVLVAHAFVAGGTSTESEQRIAVGGVETITPDTFEGFDYVALGHLHRPQQVGAPNIQYSGSLMKYSGSEIDHIKSVTVADMSGDGTVEIRRVPLQPPRDLRRIQGTLEELIEGGAQGNPNDFVVATLLDRGPVLNAMERLRQLYPNALHIEIPGWELEGNIELPDANHHAVNLDTMFERFFEEVMGEPMNPDELQVLAEVIGELGEPMDRGAS